MARREAAEAERRVRAVIDRTELTWLPERTRAVNLAAAGEGLDSPGRRLRERTSGRPCTGDAARELDPQPHARSERRRVETVRS